MATKHSKSSKQTQPQSPAAADFMAGKLMACRTLKVLSELPDAGNGGSASIWADYRSDTQYTVQANPVGDDLRALLAHPELIDGYGAAMTHACAALFELDEGREMAEDLARAPYEACRTDKPFKDSDYDGNFEAPPLYEQLGIAPPADAAIAAPAADWRAHALQVLSEVDGLITDADQIDESGLLCKSLLRRARELLGEIKPQLADEPAYDADTVMDDFFELQALVAGASAVEDAPRGFKVLTEFSAKFLKDAIHVIDEAEATDA
jgi:hypothetical protein